jgi:hypothetical protein
MNELPTAHYVKRYLHQLSLLSTHAYHDSQVGGHYDAVSTANQGEAWLALQLSEGSLPSFSQCGSTVNLTLSLSPSLPLPSAFPPGVCSPQYLHTVLWRGGKVSCNPYPFLDLGYPFRGKALVHPRTAVHSSNGKADQRRHHVIHMNHYAHGCVGTDGSPHPSIAVRY